MKQIVFVLFAIAGISGCDSSKPAPKPFKWDSSQSSKEAPKKVEQSQKQNPCSAENLKNATEEQKRKCDPTTGMNDSLGPKRNPAPKK